MVDPTLSGTMARESEGVGRHDPERGHTVKDFIEEMHVRVTDIDKTLVEVKALMAMRESRAVTLYQKVDQIFECLIGSVEPTKPSVITRLDRLEQIRENNKIIWVIVTGLVINAAWAWLKHG